MLLFWVIRRCGFVGRYQSFGENTTSIFRAEALLSRESKAYEV
jgi:hypothetical protein